MTIESFAEELLAPARPKHVHRRAHVLVAEDDDDLRTMVVTGLRQDGHDLIVARDGVELLEYVASSMLFAEAAPEPDLIVSDIRMPGFSGLNVLAGLRDERWHTPIVLMTAYADDEIRNEAVRLGASAFFEKPFDVDDLRTAVMNLVSTSWRRPHTRTRA